MKLTLYDGMLQSRGIVSVPSLDKYNHLDAFAAISVNVLRTDWGYSELNQSLKSILDGLEWADCMYCHCCKQISTYGG